MIGLRHNFSWVHILQQDILAMVYAIAMFSVLPSCIPGRIVRNALKEKEQTLRTVRTLVRYVSHEIRTPLNIALSGLEIAIHRIPNSRIARSIWRSLDPLTDASYACKAATKIIDDLSSMESIGSGLFYTTLVDQDVSCLFDMAEQCRSFTVEKKITFRIHDVSDCSGKVFCSIDPPQIKQVLQSVVGSSTRFVPNGGFLHIEVNFCKNPPFQSTPRSRRSSPPGISSNMFFVGKKSIVSKINCLLQFQSTGIFSSTTSNTRQVYSGGGGVFERRIPGKVVIKVTGNGFGASMQKFDEVFSEFSCFDATALEGDKGCGLGLWISKEIMKRHGGNISFEQKEMDHGTFCIELNGYNLLEPRNSMKKSIQDFVQSVSRRISQVSERSFSRQGRHSFRSLNEPTPDGLVVQECAVVRRPTSPSMPAVIPATLASFEPSPGVPFSSSVSHRVLENCRNLPSPRRLQKTRPVLFIDVDQSNKLYKGEIHRVQRYRVSSASEAEASTPSHDVLSISTSTARSILHKSFVREKEDNALRHQLSIDRDSKGEDEDNRNGPKTPTPLEPAVRPQSFFEGLTIRILVVDDVAMNRKMISQMLRLSQKKYFPRLCLDICEADDGTSALNEIAKSVAPFDIVLMDNVMDNLCGPQAAKQMRQQDFKGKIIGVTGNVLKKDIEDFILHGADSVLCKPVGVGDFEMILRSWVDANC